MASEFLRIAHFSILENVLANLNLQNKANHHSLIYASESLSDALGSLVVFCEITKELYARTADFRRRKEKFDAD